MSEPNDRERELALEWRRKWRSADMVSVAELLARYREELNAPAKVCEAFERLMRDARDSFGGRPYSIKLHEYESEHPDMLIVTIATDNKERPMHFTTTGAKTLAAACASLTSSTARTAELAQDDADALAAMEGE